MEPYFSEYLLQLQDEAQNSDLGFRRAALDAFHSYGMPRRKQDPWKYVDNSALLNLPCGAKQTAQAEANRAEANIGADSFANIALQKISGISDLHFYNDQLCEAPNSPDSPNFPKKFSASVRSESWAISGIKPEDLQNCAEQKKLDRESLDSEENSYSLINAFSFRHAYNLQAGLSSGESAKLRLCFAGQNGYQAPRIYIQIPQNAKLCILLDSRNLGPEVYWNPYFFFEMGANAQLTLLDRGPSLRIDGAHVRTPSLRGNLGTGAKVNAALFYWGSMLAVHDARFDIHGERAETEMRSLCFGEGRSAYHLRCENQHLAPNSRSHCLYKNVLFDRATSEFYGIIRAEPNGIGTDAEQSNQNLLLSETARAIARPQLEILIDDLQCRHGSSTGSINEEELFYMMTRCLSRDEAMHLAVDGFVREISGYFEKELLDALGIETCLESLLQKRNS